MGTGIILSIPTEAALKAILHFDFSRGFVKRRGVVENTSSRQSLQRDNNNYCFSKVSLMCLYEGERGLYH